MFLSYLEIAQSIKKAQQINLRAFDWCQWYIKLLEILVHDQLLYRYIEHKVVFSYLNSALEGEGPLSVPEIHCAGRYISVLQTKLNAQASFYDLSKVFHYGFFTIGLGTSYRLLGL